MIRLSQRILRHRFNNTQVGLNRLENVPLYSSFQRVTNQIRSAWKPLVLIVQPLQFHDNLVLADSLFFVATTRGKWSATRCLNLMSRMKKERRDRGRRDSLRHGGGWNSPVDQVDQPPLTLPKSLAVACPLSHWS